MSVERVNVIGLELVESLDEAGFRHVATSVGERLGAHRIGASVYEAEAGKPIWPYHYHHGIEEWLYVIAGAPVLREPAGERTLAPGELVPFPTGPRGAHTVSGPGRFVIFATGEHVEPWMSVYPDSDKVSGPEGILLRSSAVGYWHGEGTAGASEPDEVVHEPASPPPALDTAIVDLGPGAAGEPYHYTYGREEWLLVLAGTPTLRHPRGRGPARGRRSRLLPGGPGRRPPPAQPRRVGRPRAAPVDHGPAGRDLLPGHGALAAPPRRAEVVMGLGCSRGRVNQGRWGGSCPSKTPADPSYSARGSRAPRSCS